MEGVLEKNGVDHLLTFANCEHPNLMGLIKATEIHPIFINTPPNFRKNVGRAVSGW